MTGGFTLPRGKQRIAWDGQDALLVAREWSPGDLTASGYPFIVKRLQRGQPLSRAVEVFRGAKTDGGYGVTPVALHDGAGHTATIVARPISTFEAEYYLMTAAGPQRLNVPLESQPDALVAGRLLFRLRQDWTAGGSTFPKGSLVAVDLAEATADPQHLKPSPVYLPGPRETLESVDQTSSHLVVVTYENVRGRAWIYTPTKSGWSKQRLDLPDDSSIFVNDADARGEGTYVTTASFLTPSSLWHVNANDGALKLTLKSPSRFDASQRYSRAARGDVEGRHADSVLHRAPEEPAARRQQPDPALRVRRLQRLADAATTTLPWASCGSIAAASTCWRTSAAAASSVRRGTTRASRPTASASTTTLRPSRAI